jgi:hypothetical protein
MRPIFMGNHPIIIMTLFWALPPPVRYSPVAVVSYSLYAIGEKFPVQGIVLRKDLPRGAGLEQERRSSPGKGFFPGQKNSKTRRRSFFLNGKYGRRTCGLRYPAGFLKSDGG